MKTAWFTFEAPPYRYLNIYRSYFQSCLFTGVLEFYVEKNRMSEFTRWLSYLSQNQREVSTMNASFLCEVIREFLSVYVGANNNFHLV